VSTKTFQLDSGAFRALMGGLAVLALAAAFFAAKWGFAHAVGARADGVEVASLATGLAPDDPATHYALAVQSEKVFTADAQEKALAEFEKAAALSPYNYLFWLDLGRARERNGDQAGAEAALRKAQELAPNYSRVQWALGNALLRQGRNDEAFAEIRKAVSGDATYTNAAAMSAWQILDGDISSVRNAIGESPRSNAALAALLAREKRFDEAFAIWNEIPAGDKAGDLRETAQTLYGQFIEAGRFRFAATVRADIDGGAAPPVGQLANGGFEESLPLENTSIFLWRMSDGQVPRIGPTDGQKHSGSYSLLISFGQGSKSSRQVSQTVPVESGKSYSFELFYRSDVKTQSKIKWEIVSGIAGKPVASTDALTPSGDWVPVRVNFTVPADIDGITVRLAVEDCVPATCSISGNIWFDDLVLKSQ
jgi:tetratricopeptide (TPR) repeat protein